MSILRYPHGRERPITADLTAAADASTVRQDTLGDLLRRAASANLPARFYALLQLCVPIAVHLWSIGWYRAAGLLFTASLFGVWALAQQRMTSIEALSSSAEFSSLLSPWSRRLWKAVRGVAGGIGTLGAFTLLIEGFIQILKLVFHCPGCAG